MFRYYFIGTRKWITLNQSIQSISAYLFCFINWRAVNYHISPRHANSPEWLVLRLKSRVKKSPSPTLVISTFGLAETISCMPDGLVTVYIGYWQTCQYSRIYLYIYVICCLISSNVLFIQPLAFCRNWKQRR
jgi:hypothetical protein